MAKKPKVVLTETPNVRGYYIRHLSHRNKRKNHERELLMHFPATSVSTSSRVLAEYSLPRNTEKPLAHRITVSAATLIYLIAPPAHAQYESRKRPPDHIRRV